MCVLFIPQSLCAPEAKRRHKGVINEIMGGGSPKHCSEYCVNRNKENCTLYNETVILTPKIRRCFLFSIFDVILLFDLNEYEGDGRSHQQIYLQIADFLNISTLVI